MATAIQLLARRQSEVLRHAALATALAAAVLLVMLQIAGVRITPLNAGFVFLLLTLLIASTFGLRAGLVAAGVSGFVVNYFFLEPIHGLSVRDEQHIISIILFFVVVPLGVLLGSNVARTAEPVNDAELTPQPAAIASLTIDTSNSRALLDGADVRLTPTEFSLLSYLAAHPGQVVRPQTILREVWGEEYVDDVRILRTYVNQLRAKLQDDAANPRFIGTLPGFGYRFLTPDV